jgi:hypothetical protein
MKHWNMNEVLNSCKAHNKKIQKQECMKYEALGVMNSLNQSFEIDLQRKAK